MRLTYTEQALHELAAAVQYYRSCQDGLGREFYIRVEAAEEDIIAHPQAWRSVGKPYRRKLLQKFPYGLVYHEVAEDWIEIVAVMHLHRQPDYWRKRLG
jgi:plasmid stabilization system protein ParE